MTSLPYWLTTWIEILFSMITCMSRWYQFCCSDAWIRTVTSTLLNMLRPRSLHLHVPSYIIIISPYMPVWLPPMTPFSSIIYRTNWRSSGLYNRETIRTTYSVSIVKRIDLCDCVIQTTEIQLIGSHTNCSSNGNFLIHHTFNFVTQWIYNKRDNVLL